MPATELTRYIPAKSSVFRGIICGYLAISKEWDGEQVGGEAEGDPMGKADDHMFSST